MATSDAFTDNAIRNFYHCIKKFDDGVYTLVMNDRYFLFIILENNCQKSNF